MRKQSSLTADNLPLVSMPLRAADNDGIDQSKLLDTLEQFIDPLAVFVVRTWKRSTTRSSMSISAKRLMRLFIRASPPYVRAPLD